MGEKKKKVAAQQTWKKVLFVIAAVLFVFVMVISSMGTNWITGLAPVKAGDTVVLDYTIYDASGVPFLTTSQQVYKEQAAKGAGVLFAKQQLTLTADQSLNQAIYPVTVYTPINGGSWQDFAIYNPEYNAISSGVVGMKTSETKKIVLPTNNTMTTLFSPEDLEKVNVNMSALDIGDTMLMGVSENPNASAANSTAVSYLRLGEISRKSDAGLVVDFGYPYAEITLYKFTNQ